MTRLRVGLLSNPAAGAGSAQRIGRQVSHLLRLAGISVIDLSGPSAAVARARAGKVRDTLTALVVVGGDGTIAMGAQIVAGTPVRLGVIAAGSGNDFARALSLPINDPEAGVRMALQALSRPVTTIDAIEVMSVAPNLPAHRSVVLGNVSLGFDALVSARTQRLARGGALRYTASLLQELHRFSPIPYWVEVDGGERMNLDASVVTLASTGVLGGGMRLVPDALVDDGLLDMAVIEGMSRTRLLRELPRVFRGSHTDLDAFSVRRVQEVTVGVRDGRELRSYGDGEALAPLPVRIRVLPGAVRLLRTPASSDTSLGRRRR